MGYMPFKVAMEAQGHEEGCYMVLLKLLNRWISNHGELYIHYGVEEIH